MHETPARFDAVGGDYARFRPSYPASLMVRLKERFAETSLATGVWIDVGCGTGIFTRQLAENLPVHMPVIGLEPSAAMRRGRTSVGEAELACPVYERHAAEIGQDVIDRAQAAIARDRRQ